MWRDPYLETCCRSALHRLALCDADGRPPGMKDGPCLARLQSLGLVLERDDGRFFLTPSGRTRHENEVLKLSARRA